MRRHFNYSILTGLLMLAGIAGGGEAKVLYDADYATWPVYHEDCRDRVVDDQPDYLPNQILIVLKDTVPVDHESDLRGEVALGHLPGFSAVAARMNVTRLQPQFPGKDKSPLLHMPSVRALARYFLVEFEDRDPLDVVAEYAVLPAVKLAQPDYILRMGYKPNDYYFDDKRSSWPYDQWHLMEAPGVDAVRAWDYCKGDSSVLVGVIDGGVEYDHWDLGSELNPPGPDDPDTDGCIWVNTLEIPGNGIDDDGNGRTDDVIGWDVRTNSNEVDDVNGHGTGCASVIASLNNNGLCVAGIGGGARDGSRVGPYSEGVRIVPVGAADDGGSTSWSNVSAAFNYLGDLKAAGWNIVAINFSHGSSYNGAGSAIDYCVNQGILVVACAMNDDSGSPHYPAARSNVLGVAATDTLGIPADFTNYGSWVDVAAPGAYVMVAKVSEDHPEDWNTFWVTGTSFAAPHVAGIAALLKSYDPSLTHLELWDLIVGNTTPYDPIKDCGSGIANAWLALQQILDEVVIEHAGPVNLSVSTDNQAIVATVRSLGGGAIPPTGVQLSYRVDGGTYVSIEMTPTGQSDEFGGVIPPQPMGSLVEYFLEASNDEGQVGTLPMDAPDELFTYFISHGVSEGSEEPRGWCSGGPDEETGAPGWEWADPEYTEWDGELLQPEDDHSPEGSHCWTTGGLAGPRGGGDYDLDGGETVLYSPRYDVTGASDVVLSYWYYYRSFLANADYPPDPGYEPALLVELSNDGGGSWTEIQRTETSTADWMQTAVVLDTLVAEPGVVQLRFTAADRQSRHLIEALIDDFQLVGVFAGTDVDEGLDVAIPTRLAQNHPNPFNPITTISFQLSREGRARLAVYDLQGRLVRRLVEGYLPAGPQELSWDGRDECGRRVASGMYMYRLDTADCVRNKRMLLVK